MAKKKLVPSATPIGSEVMDRRAVRLQNFNDWIIGFQDFCKQQYQISKIDFVEDSSELLNNQYWLIADTYIRPLVSAKGDKRIESLDVSDLESRINRFKIISATELIIMQVLPIKYTPVLKKMIYAVSPHMKAYEKDEEVLEKAINSIFAWFIGFNILSTFDSKINGSTEALYISSLRFTFDPQNGELTKAENTFSILQDHIHWLTFLEPQFILPIFINAQFWKMFCLSILIKMKEF